MEGNNLSSIGHIWVSLCRFFIPGYLIWLKNVDKMLLEVILSFKGLNWRLNIKINGQQVILMPYMESQIQNSFRKTNNSPTERIFMLDL